MYVSFFKFNKICTRSTVEMLLVKWLMSCEMWCACLGGGGEANAKREAHEAQILTCSRPDSQTRISLITPQDTT